MDYIPHTKEDIRYMLDVLGLDSIDELFEDIPNSIKLNRELDIPDGITEVELTRNLRDIASLNLIASKFLWFLGGGCYRHFIPQALNEVIRREEFYTSYTPYQAELSQGTLQALFEFQTLICDLLGMDVANDSMYDGATASAEAMFMACDITKRDRILVARSLHPEYRITIETYAKAKGIEVIEVPFDKSSGMLDIDVVNKFADRSSGLIFQNPNFFGVIEDPESFESMLHNVEALVIPVIVEPFSLALIKPPGEYKADIVCGDLQSFGLGMRYGGPSAGFLSTKIEYIRRLPGRIVGLTNDAEGKLAYAFVLQTREQHIRRASATSNICSNEALCAIKIVIYLSLLGEEGLKDIALTCYKLADIARKKLGSYFTGFSFNEFLVPLNKNSSEVRDILRKKNILVLDPSRWYPELDNTILVTFTEMNREEEIYRLIEEIEPYVRRFSF
ncbi:MAG: aminomethyl-transferring glycine dehydrogenase subunit GcvPA [bacterium]|nr:aminomethyl-transferring glycine dehydrogenase subunit GcvPA [bacterium]